MSTPAYCRLEDLPEVEPLIDAFVEQLPCRAPGPYPEPKVEGMDEQTANLLLDAFANGGSAELTAIAQYFQHSLTITDPVISNLELCISLSEMKHLDLIGGLIESLGGKPKYWATNRFYWTGGHVGYGETTSGKVALDIQSEREAIAGYERLLRQTQHPAVRAVLERILADEIVHLSLFEQAYARAKALERGEAGS